MPQGSKSRAPNWKSSETLDLLQAIKVHIEKEDLDPAKYLETTGPWRRLKWSNPHSRSLEHVHSKLINLSKVAEYSSQSCSQAVRDAWHASGLSKSPGNASYDVSSSLRGLAPESVGISMATVEIDDMYDVEDQAEKKLHQDEEEDEEMEVRVFRGKNGPEVPPGANSAVNKPETPVLERSKDRSSETSSSSGEKMKKRGAWTREPLSPYKGSPKRVKLNDDGDGADDDDYGTDGTTPTSHKTPGGTSTMTSHRRSLVAKSANNNIIAQSLQAMANPSKSPEELDMMKKELEQRERESERKWQFDQAQLEAQRQFHLQMGALVSSTIQALAKAFGRND